MLCKINATLGTTDEKARAMNFMRAVTNIFTAASGTTPTCNPLTASNTFNNAINIITEVTSNTEGGGWTRTADSNVVDAYNASLASYYQVDFTSNVLTGKATYPYLKCTLSTNLSQTMAGTYTTYPYLDFRIGFNSTSSYANTYSQAMTVSNVTANVITAQPGQTTVNTTSYATIRPAGGEYLVAATARYVAFLASNAVTYFGYRTTQAWEDPLLDNPPVVAFSANTQGDSVTTYSTFGAGGATMISNYAAWMYGQGAGGQGNITVTPKWYISTINSAGTWSGVSTIYNPLSGTVATTSLAHVEPNFSPSAMSMPFNTYTTSNQPGFQLNSPLMYLRTHNTGLIIGSVTDTDSNTQVSAAIPLTFACTMWPAYAQGAVSGATYLPYGYNGGGTAIGIYKGSGGPDTYIANIWTAGTNYTIGSDTYYSYRVGYYTGNRDIFLIRKA